MNTKEIARTLATITEEQWEAILTTSNCVIKLPLVQELSKRERVGKGASKAKTTEEDLRFEVTDLITRIGVPPHVLGYKYLQDAIMLVYKDETYIHNIVKKLYPAIAERHNTEGSKVERSIRHAFDLAYRNGDSKVLEEIFKTKDVRPVNSHGIAAMVEYIKMYD